MNLLDLIGLGMAAVALQIQSLGRPFFSEDMKNYSGTTNLRS